MSENDNQQLIERMLENDATSPMISSTKESGNYYDEDQHPFQQNHQ